MRDDLLHAQASVDWAETNLPSFKKRLDAWLHDNVYVAIREQPLDSPHDALVPTEKEPLPLRFHIEAGAYINAIRSSLDILACALANRYCKTLVDIVSFPIARSPEHFDELKRGKFIKALPATEQTIIEELKPYKGGNDLLYALHMLDIVRKYRRLLTVATRPRVIVAFGWAPRGGDDETKIGLFAKGAPQANTDFIPQVSLSETAYLPRREIVTALHEFADSANSIIGSFGEE
jgi:hypothetical protein